MMKKLIKIILSVSLIPALFQCAFAYTLINQSNQKLSYTITSALKNTPCEISLQIIEQNSLNPHQSKQFESKTDAQLPTYCIKAESVTLTGHGTPIIKALKPSKNCIITYTQEAQADQLSLNNACT